MKRPLHERAERAVKDLAREMVGFIRRCESGDAYEKKEPWSVEDTEYYLQEAWLRGYTARRRDEKAKPGPGWRKANG